MAAEKARSTIVKRGEALGIDWTGALTDLQSQDWQERMRQVTNPDVTYPAYYTQPFHAYEKGNLCLEAALEVTLAAQSVHATVMDPAGKALDPLGDHQLRSSYSKCQVAALQSAGVDASSVRSVLDLGCATGLSSLALLEAFPNAHVTGVDLSPHFLAVGQYQQQQRQVLTGKPEALTFVHGAAESTGLPSGSFDVVSMCLVCHELPQQATRAIVTEAFRLLKPGGFLGIMEMDPRSEAWQRIFKNPFAFAAFKSTEPWLNEYIQVDFPEIFTSVGFNEPSITGCTPRHMGVVAMKPKV